MVMVVILVRLEGKPGKVFPSSGAESAHSMAAGWAVSEVPCTGISRTSWGLTWGPVCSLSVDGKNQGRP